MQQPNPQEDPIVTILQLAYKRGLQLRQEKTAGTTPLNDNQPDARLNVIEAARDSDSRKRACKGNQHADTNT